MAKRITRNIRSIKDIEKQPKYTNKQNDLLSDEKDVYVRNKDQYEQITGGVKEVNGETPDENGNVNLQLKDFAGQEKIVRKSQLDESLEAIESGYKNYTDNAVEDMAINDRNLLTGTSAEWVSYSFDGYIGDSFIYTPEQLGLSTGDTLTYSVKYDNTKDTNNDSAVNALVNFYSKDDNIIEGIKGNKILDGEVGLSFVTGNIPEGTAEIRAYKAYKNENDNKKLVSAKEHKLQLGTRATPWTPAPEDIALKSELEQIKQAIINLGGEI
ncbi:BppU family phage baseplate upper protein [Tetragenococcus phage phiWJ7]|nr:BppU family phage baseplate upper protein [Tetragenococcus phage phiWJ7]